MPSMRNMELLCSFNQSVRMRFICSLWNEKHDVLEAASNDSNPSLLSYTSLLVTNSNGIQHRIRERTFVESLQQRRYDPAHLIEERL